LEKIVRVPRSALPGESEAFVSIDVDPVTQEFRERMV